MNINAIWLQITDYHCAVQTGSINSVVSAASSVICRVFGSPLLNNTSNESFKEKESLPTNGILTNFLSSKWYIVNPKDYLIPYKDDKETSWGKVEEFTFTSPLSKQEQKELAQPDEELKENKSFVKAELNALMKEDPALGKLSPRVVSKMRYQDLDTMCNTATNQSLISSLAKEKSWVVVPRKTI